VKFRRQSRDEDSINLTPLIDVVFLLLIFFMVSTTFTKETHLQIDLPEATGDSQPQNSKQIEILINSEGGFAVNGESVINKQIATLKMAIEKVSEGNTDLPMIITADANTPYQAVVTAMDAAGQLGFVNLSMTTKNPQADGV
jgi:biopolymer transport protein ExbD